MHGYSKHKQGVIKRLRRAEGQIRGVSSMVADDKYCIDILTQISAVQAALDKVAVELLRDHARNCLAPGHAPNNKDKKADELAEAVGRMLSR